MNLEIDNKIKGNNEVTSSISSISYGIEDFLYNKNKIKRSIHSEIIRYKKENKFPQNLEFIDAFLDKDHSMSASAFLDKNTGKVIVGFSGTNFGSGTLHGLQDVLADKNIGTNIKSAYHPHNRNMQNFIDGIKKNYQISTFTGHSLGGHNAVIFGLRNHIDDIVVYNSAPIYNNATLLLPFDIITTDEHHLNLNQKSEDEKLKVMREEMVSYIPFVYRTLNKIEYLKIQKDYVTYNGKITWFVSDKDELNMVNQFTFSKYMGKKIVIPNGKGHSMSYFLENDAQSIIKNSRVNYKEVNYQFSSIKKYINHSSKALKNILNLAVQIQSTNGHLSSQQKIVLEKISSLVILEDYRSITSEMISVYKAEYDESKEKFKVLWENGIYSAELLGDELSESERYSALADGGVTKEIFIDRPFDNIDEKMNKLHQFEKECNTLIDKIKHSIEKLIEKDDELSSLFGVYIN
ncbi:hypothetical protein RW115_06470 [Macrococcus capreoli]